MFSTDCEDIVFMDHLENPLHKVCVNKTRHVGPVKIIPSHIPKVNISDLVNNALELPTNLNFEMKE